MKKNGFTLVELLAAIAISGIALSITFSIFYTGIKQGENTKGDVFLQQEANIIATSLRSHHLDIPSYELTIHDKKIQLEIVKPDSTTHTVVISEGYQYVDVVVEYMGTKYEKVDGASINLPVETKNPVTINLTISDGSSQYTLRTTLSRGV